MAHQQPYFLTKYNQQIIPYTYIFINQKQRNIIQKSHLCILSPHQKAQPTPFYNSYEGWNVMYFAVDVFFRFQQREATETAEPTVSLFDEDGLPSFSLNTAFLLYFIGRLFSRFIFWNLLKFFIL